MTALPNADNPRGLNSKPNKTGKEKPSPSSVKLMKRIDAIDKKTGVSVRYAQKPYITTTGIHEC